LLGVVAYIATGRVSYTALVVLGAFALGLCDTFVSREVERSDEDA
jgi:hypothetical protein